MRRTKKRKEIDEVGRFLEGFDSLGVKQRKGEVEISLSNPGHSIKIRGGRCRKKRVLSEEKKEIGRKISQITGAKFCEETGSIVFECGSFHIV